jgi:lysophospholipase L1-like esterase
MAVVAWVHRAAFTIAVAGLAMLVADLPTRDPIVSSLRAGQRVVSLQTEATTATAPPPTTAPAAPPVAAPPPPPVAAPVPPAGPPPGTVTVAAIGDSVMLGAAPQLQNRLGPTGFIDARVGRQFNQGVDVARQFREQGKLGEVAVIHLGTNGPPRARDVDAIMSQLAGVPHVLLVTARMPRTWEGETNAALRAAAAKYPAIAIVDWYGYSDGHPDWFQSDGIHLRPAGAEAYAALIGGALPMPPPPPPPTEPPPPPPTEPPPPEQETTTTSAPAPPG